MRKDANPMRDAPSVTDLVTQARNGDKPAWDALVDRYAPLVWSICRRYRLVGADADDAGQAVWLRLVDQVGQIRDPAALPGWLATTTRRECGRIVRAARRTQPPGHSLDVEDIPDEQPHRPTIRSRAGSTHPHPPCRIGAWRACGEPGGPAAHSARICIPPLSGMPSRILDREGFSW
jgi:RNA polymerase sigma factor (sigma-70 family)